MVRGWLKQRIPLILITIALFTIWSLLPDYLVQKQQRRNRAARWEAQIKAFEAQDQTNAPPKGAVLFVGSSSVRLWKTLRSDLGSLPVIRRGFGGAHIEDALIFADRIITPYAPELVFLYAGDNDLAANKSPKQVLADFTKLVEHIHARLPETRIAFISIKPSLARWHLIRKIRKANALVKEYTASNPLLDFIDVFHPMLDKQGNPKKELYAGDGLHLNTNGYHLWTSVLKEHLSTAAIAVATAD